MLDTQEQLRNKHELELTSYKQQVTQLQSELHTKLLSAEHTIGGKEVILIIFDRSNHFICYI